ncbi:dephospho-CoA kinase [Candidatus Peregrinibacteria bacterium]|nr:dephospho-CoA kinase [Candidatus Peregrinibacteria bacterium]
MIIGLTGPMASGKTTVVNALKKNGFKHITLSAIIREEAKNQNIEEKRENLMAIGQKLREEFGAGVLAKKSLEKIISEGGDKWLVDGIRNPAEVLELRNNPNFILIANTAPEDLIVERIFGRKRDDDTLDKETIRKQLKREMGEGEPEDGQQVAKCIDMADYIFENTMPVEEVESEFMKLYNQIINNSN